MEYQSAFPRKPQGPHYLFHYDPLHTSVTCFQFPHSFLSSMGEDFDLFPDGGYAVTGHRKNSQGYEGPIPFVIKNPYENAQEHNNVLDKFFGQAGNRALHNVDVVGNPRH